MNLHKRTLTAFSALMFIILPVCFLTGYVWSTFSGIKQIDQIHIVLPLVGLGVFLGALLSLPQTVRLSVFLKAVIVAVSCLLLLFLLPYLKFESWVVFWFFLGVGTVIMSVNIYIKCTESEDERSRLINEKAAIIALVIACLYLFFGVFAMTRYAISTGSDVVAVKDLTFLITWYAPVYMLAYAMAGMHYARKYGTEADE